MTGSKKIVLITPPEKHLLMEAGDRPDLGTIYVASSLKRAGHKPVVVDLNHRDYRQLFGYIDGADFIGMTTKTPYFSWLTQYADHLRHNFPDVPLIAGGPHATVAPESIERHFDFVVIGEGEPAIVEIVEGRVPKGRVQFPYEEDLDMFAPPDWGLIDTDEYGIKQEGYRTWPLLTSRSCPKKCAFCTKDILGPKQRTHSIDRVMQEIAAVYHGLGIGSFYIYDDYFISDERRIMEFAKRVLESDLHITFRAITRTDTLTEDALQALKRAGLRSLDFGFEHADDGVLELVDKDNTVANNQRAVNLCKKNGVRIRGSFIVNLPGATPETAYRTLDFVTSNRLDWADFYPLIAYPGTPIWKYPEKFGVRVDRRYDLFQSGLETNVDSDSFPKSEVPGIVRDVRERWFAYKASRVPYEIR